MNTAKTNDPRNNQNRRKRGRHGARPEKAQAGFGGRGRGETENRPSPRLPRPSTNMNILPRGQSPMKEHRIERSGCLRGKAVNRRRKATLRRAGPKPQARPASRGKKADPPRGHAQGGALRAARPNGIEFPDPDRLRRRPLRQRGGSYPANVKNK